MWNLRGDRPSGAIPTGGREVVRGVRKWHIDAEKCYRYWNTIGQSCGVCQVVCPWSHANNWFHKSIRELASGSSRLRKLLVMGDKLFYSYKPGLAPKWMREPV